MAIFHSHQSSSSASPSHSCCCTGEGDIRGGDLLRRRGSAVGFYPSSRSNLAGDRGSAAGSSSTRSRLRRCTHPRFRAVLLAPYVWIPARRFMSEFWHRSDLGDLGDEMLGHGRQKKNEKEDSPSSSVDGQTPPAAAGIREGRWWEAPAAAEGWFSRVLQPIFYKATNYFLRTQELQILFLNSCWT